MKTKILSGFLTLLTLLLSLQSVSMDEAVPYEFKNERNLDRLLVRTRIPATLEDMERKVVYLKELVSRIGSVGESALAGDGVEKLIERAVLEVKRDKRDIEDAISALNVNSTSIDTAAITSQSDKNAIEASAKNILKKYETDDNPMEEREVKEVRNWLQTQPKATWWYKSETRTPMQMYKSASSKVYVWPRDFNFPSFLKKHENILLTSRQQMLDLLRSGLVAISTRGDTKTTLELKREWKMRLDLVDKFTADTLDATEIAERLQAFERIVLTLLTNTDLTGNAIVMKKWLLMNQMMYAVDGVSDQEGLVKPWDADKLGGGFPVSTFNLPVMRQQSASIQDEIEVDTEQTTQKTEKKQSSWAKLKSKVFANKQSKADRNTETKITEVKGADTKSTGSQISTTTATTPTGTTPEPPKKKGWFSWS